MGCILLELMVILMTTEWRLKPLRTQVDHFFLGVCNSWFFTFPDFSCSSVPKRQAGGSRDIGWANQRSFGCATWSAHPSSGFRDGKAPLFTTDWCGSAFGVVWRAR